MIFVQCPRGRVCGLLVRPVMHCIRFIAAPVDTVLPTKRSDAGVTSGFDEGLRLPENSVANDRHGIVLFSRASMVSRSRFTSHPTG